MARNDVQRSQRPAPKPPTIVPGARLSGEIVRVTDKGFGFIKTTDGNEYFVHFSNCGPGAWEEIVDADTRGARTKVTFEATQTAKGLRALAVLLQER